MNIESLHIDQDKNPYFKHYLNTSSIATRYQLALNYLESVSDLNPANSGTLQDRQSVPNIQDQFYLHQNIHKYYQAYSQCSPDQKLNVYPKPVTTLINFRNLAAFLRVNVYTGIFDEHLAAYMSNTRWQEVIKELDLPAKATPPINGLMAWAQNNITNGKIEIINAATAPDPVSQQEIIDYALQIKTPFSFSNKTKSVSPKGSYHYLILADLLPEDATITDMLLGLTEMKSYEYQDQQPSPKKNSSSNTITINDTLFPFLETHRFYQLLPQSYHQHLSKCTKQRFENSKNENIDIDQSNHITLILAQAHHHLLGENQRKKDSHGVFFIGA
jgi:hypothetical protein